MAMNDLTASLGVSASGMRAQATRLRHVAENIANADTPNYKARDFDFSTALKEAVAGRPDAGGLPVSKTNSGHMSPTPGSGPVALLYRTPMQASVDGNTVEMDVERQKMAENSLMHQFSLDRVSGHFKHFMELLQNLK